MTDDFDFDVDTEMDAMELASRGSDGFNASSASYPLDEDGNVAYVLPWDAVGGVPAVLAVEMSADDDPLRVLLETTVAEHLAHPSPGDPRGNCYRVIDPCLDDHAKPTLPPWSPHGPQMQNVVLALIAGRTHEVRPLRGAFTVSVLAEQIVNGDIETVCSIRRSPNCTPDEPREIFTMRFGNFVCFFRACAHCYFDYFEQSTSFDGGYSYECLDPREYAESEFNDDFFDDSMGQTEA